MILSIGEILADMIGETKNGILTFKMFCGGAPFNVAVNAKQSGAKVGFVGCVGEDVVGRFLIQEAKKAKLDYLDVQIDKERNTTLAFVTLKDGERNFAFNRHDTADYHIDLEKIDFSKYEELNILHLGSLMLSEEVGRLFAAEICKKAKNEGVKLSFDMNFRMDTYKDFETAKLSYAPYVEQADIIKFSEDELKLYTGMKDVSSAAKSLARENQLFFVTLGEKGSFYYYNGLENIIPTQSLQPMDTTGAGDAFFGALLAELEGKDWTKQSIESAMIIANAKGARATQFLGAIQF